MVDTRLLADVSTNIRRGGKYPTTITPPYNQPQDWAKESALVRAGPYESVIQCES